MYRTSLVRMYYTSISGDTPEPFAEFRVFIVSENKIDIDYYRDYLDFYLEYCEWIFVSVMFSILKRKVYHQIEGFEVNEKIDDDEGKENLRTTGLSYPKYGSIYRYVRFIKKNSRVIEYNEKEIIDIESSRRLEIELNLRNISFSRFLKLKSLMGLISERRYLIYKKIMKQLGL